MDTLNRTLSVAPMMDCTDRHCRAFMRMLAPGALLYSEMVTSAALIHGDSERFLRHAGDEPCALQLGGSQPADLANCARLAEDAGYQEVNLNCGCPSDRVQQGGIGACLMAEPALVAECYAAMAEATTLPVTIKSRIGIDDHDSYAFFTAFIEPLYNAGCRVFAVHARKAILKGLSPRENREIPPLHYDFVYRVREDFPDATFVLNGGLKSKSEVESVMPKVDGVMLGRAVYQSPLLLAELDEALNGSAPLDINAFLAESRDYLAAGLEEGTALKHMARHLLGLFAGWPGARAFRRTLSEGMNREGATLAVFDDALAQVRGLANLPSQAGIAV